MSNRFETLIFVRSLSIHLDVKKYYVFISYLL